MSLTPGERFNLVKQGIPRPEDVHVIGDLHDQLHDPETRAQTTGRLNVIRYIGELSVPKIHPDRDPERDMLAIRVAQEVIQEGLERPVADAVSPQE